VVIRSIQEKLRSRRGASISFALLLFLVCAVVGSVVLTAGTAAAGRVSQLTDQDQRYYAVTSAAGLFRDSLDGQSFTITRTKTTTVEITTVYTLDENGASTVNSGYPSEAETAVVYAATISGAAVTAPSAGNSLLESAALELVFGNLANYQNETAWTHTVGSEASAAWNLTVTPTGYEDLAVAVAGSMAGSGNIELTFQNEEGDPFRLGLTLEAKVTDRSTPRKTERSLGSDTARTDNGDGTVTVTTVETVERTETKTATVQWSAAAVRKVSA